MRKTSLEMLIFAALLPILYGISMANYLLFHTFIELISILVTFALFTIAWNTRKFNESHYLLYLGIAYLFVGCIDLLHSLSYKGMNILVGYDADLPTQLWIVARYIEAFSLVVASFLLGRKINSSKVLLLYTVVSTGLVVVVFMRWFPACFVEGTGLTLFKKTSEYIISLIMLYALWRIYRQKEHVLPEVRRMLYLSIILTIIAEISFTFYISVYGFSNFVGHVCKLYSFYLIYKALVVTSLNHPYTTLFNNIKQSEARFRSYVDNAPDGIFVADETGHYVSVNKAASRITGYTEEELLARGIPDLRLSDDTEYALQSFHMLKEKGKISITETFQTKSGETRIWEVNAVALSNNRFLGFAKDITKRHWAEQQLQLSNERYKKAQQLGHVGNWEYIIETGTFWGSEEAKKIYGLPHEKELFTPEEVEQCIPERERVHQALEDLIQHNIPYNLEFTIITRDKGEKRIINTIGELQRDASGTPQKIAGVLIDITRQKQNEMQIQQLLDEKEVLLHEVHHRIKNNMMTIESLLKLHTRSIDNEPAKAALTDASNRVKSMRVLYDKLYRSDNFTDINSYQYISPLIDEITAVFTRPDVTVEKDIQSFVIPAKMLFPLGIIINESITNAMKYAFPNGNSGSISIELKKEDNAMLLKIKDTGVGLPDGFDPTRSKSFGMQVMNLLARQLNGRITSACNNGTEIHFTTEMEA